METLHANELGACEICDHCFCQRWPWHYCALGNDEFGDISSPDECDDFEFADDDDDNNDDDEDDDDSDDYDDT